MSAFHVLALPGPAELVAGVNHLSSDRREENGESLSIQAKCPCGASFKAKSGLAGKRVKCPVCAQPFVVPTLVEKDEKTSLADLFGGEPTGDDPTGDDPLGLGTGSELDAAQRFDDAFGDELPAPMANVARLPASKLPTKPVENQATPGALALPIDGKMIAVVSYLTLPGWTLALILHCKGDEKTSLGAFHLRQSAGLMCLGVVLSFVMSLVLAFIPFASGIAGVVVTLVSLATTVHWVYGLISAARGEEEYLISFLGDAFDGMFPWIS